MKPRARDSRKQAERTFVFPDRFVHSSGLQVAIGQRIFEYLDLAPSWPHLEQLLQIREHLIGAALQARCFGEEQICGPLAEAVAAADMCGALSGSGKTHGWHQQIARSPLGDAFEMKLQALFRCPAGLIELSTAPKQVRQNSPSPPALEI